jgi:hypothetical protein
MTTAELTTDHVKLEIHICEDRRSYFVTWEGNGADVEARIIAFLKARSSTHAYYELESEPFDFATYPALEAFLYPSCEHGLSLSNCYGPQHYYFDEEEQARGMRNGW